MAYEACEAATALLLRKYGKALFRKAASPASRLSALGKIASLLPTCTLRSAESEIFQQFSTPIPLGAGSAELSRHYGGRSRALLEPSAGTGPSSPRTPAAPLVLNELAECRAMLLSSIFPANFVTRFDAAQVDDHLHPVAPSVVLMNPPFSAMANISGRMADTTYRHIASGVARLADGGRLVTISRANFSPEASAAWPDAFVRLQQRGRVVFTAAITGAIYAKHGTTTETRLTVIDKVAGR
ncbi:hypothetical protein GGD63_006574 [Bradyrhizobium sp. cir1]|nr:hypothetical protein [Bradyrhizobium sp. cir1]MBB4373746.1 hypothetical protein [Bradyrhizobium sp. cir1]